MQGKKITKAIYPQDGDWIIDRMTSEYSNSWHLFWKRNVKIKVILRRAYFLISLLCNVKFFIHFKPIKFSFYKSKCHSQNCRSNVFFVKTSFREVHCHPISSIFRKRKTRKKSVLVTYQIFPQTSLKISIKSFHTQQQQQQKITIFLKSFSKSERKKHLVRSWYQTSTVYDKYKFR